MNVAPKNVSTSSQFFEAAKMVLQNAGTARLQAATAYESIKKDEETARLVQPVQPPQPPQPVQDLTPAKVDEHINFWKQIITNKECAHRPVSAVQASQVQPVQPPQLPQLPLLAMPVHTNVGAFPPMPSVPNPPPNPPSPPKPPSQDSSGGDIGEPVMQENKSLHVDYEPKWVGYEHPCRLKITTTFHHAQPDYDHELIHSDLVNNDALSGPQVDGIGYGMEAVLGGHALLIGDTTGVGKGRQLAGFIRNVNLWAQRCRKHILITANPILFHDFKRDLTAVGVKMNGRDALPLRSITEWNANDSIGKFEGVLFVTYGALRVAAKEAKEITVNGKRPAGSSRLKKIKQKKTRSRLDQILEWTGPDFDGVVAMDEIHNCKDHKSMTSIAAVALQNRLKKAKFIYSSATAMSNVNHLASMPRLGLWGENTPYPDFKSFLNTWNSQTRSSLEIIGTELASQGLYLSRSLSFEGTQFDLVCASMTQAQSETHTRLCTWWKKLVSFDGVLVGKKNRAIMWGSHLRFFKALLVAYRVDVVSERAAKAISEGMSVVISLIGTGEQAAKRFAEEDDMDDDTVADESGFVALNMTLESIIDLAIKEYKGINMEPLIALKEEIKTFNLPPSPLDYMIHKLSSINVRGTCENVAEMTGRAKGFYASADGKWHLKNRPTTNLDSCRSFQRGDTVIAVISAAAATGISLQNTRSGPNRPRLHMIVELAWAADQALQALGRTHRADQHNAPHYNLVVSNLEAEGRFAATVSKRARDMGAVTTGDRRGTNQEKTFGSDLLIGAHSHEGLRMLTSAVFSKSWPIWLSHAPDEDWNTFSDQVAQVLADMKINTQSKPRHLMGRLLGIPMNQSNMCMRIYEAACIESQLSSDARKRQSGIATDLGVEDMCIGEKASIVRHTRTDICEVAVDIGIDFDTALQKGLEWKASGNKMSFFKRKETPGLERSYIVLALLKKPRVECFRPNGRQTRYFVEEFKKFYSEIGSKDGLFEKGTPAYTQAKSAWDEEYNLSLHVCSHGSSCHYGAACTFGKREVHSTLVKMPGAINRLHGYTGMRQIIRLDDTGCGSFASSSSDTTSNKCVAVRIAKGCQERLEAVCESEVQRKKEEDKRYQTAKAELIQNAVKDGPSGGGDSELEDVMSLSADSDDDDEPPVLRRSTKSPKRQRKDSSDESSLSEGESDRDDQSEEEGEEGEGLDDEEYDDEDDDDDL